ncbi:LOW QUALITY PROTEIN: sentrin-specific protease 1 [Procambarus clarkii]|uniref:LOW QUALITY PROTEIN: sentrin-specific protease 1 n=1 Tax=Procambarus clarkii TaxID=6728 RepID=UPI003744A4DB
MGDGMLSLYWNNHRATFCHILSTLREKERYTDATLACEGKFYPVHKLVLSTCSEYFENMFEHTPCKHPIIVLKDVKPDELEALLSYMYAGVVSVAQNDLARLIKAAEMLQIKGLAVPDEPPPGDESKRPAPSRSGREDRSSPLPKKRRREENGTPSQGGSQPSNSPPSSPRASPYQPESEPSQARSRTHGDAHRTDRVDTSDQPSSHESQASDVKIMVDESLVKEEMVETLDSNQSEGMDSGMQYGHVGSDPGMDGSGGGDEHTSHMMPNKFDQPGIPGQAQPLADAVAEALAGPSGMQGWLGSDMPGGFSAENYGGEGSQEVHPSQASGPHTQQRATAETAARMSSMEAKWPKNSLAHRKVSCINKQSGFVTKNPMKSLHDRYFGIRKRKPLSKSFIYGRGNFCAQTSFRYEDKIWYGQLLQQFTGTAVLPSSHTVYTIPPRSSNSHPMRNISPLGMISRSQCSSTWTQEKRQQLETTITVSPSMPESDETAIFRIPSFPGKVTSDASIVDMTEPASVGNNIAEDVQNDKASSERQQESLHSNSLEKRLHESPIYNLDWLKSFREKYEIRSKASDYDAEILAEEQRLLEEKRKKLQASRENCISLGMRHLDFSYPSKVKLHPEDEDYEDEFAYEDEELLQLSPEMEDIIDDALQKAPAGEVLVDKFNTQITRHDISTLAGLNWLNDEVINFYMNLLMERGKNDNFPNVHAFNTFFYPKLMKTGFQTVKRWTKKIDIFSQDIVLVPIHLGMHWCLATIDFRVKAIRYYDSMLGDNNKCLEALLKYLEDEHLDKKKTSYDTSDWTLENVKDIPQQMNGSDCGMFACMFAEYLSRDGVITFDQQHMPYFRRKMVYEIIKATLL